MDSQPAKLPHPEHIEMKKAVEQYIIDKVCDPLAPCLKEGYHIGAIKDDCFEVCGQAMRDAPDDEAMTAIAQNWIDARKSEWLEYIVEIEDALVIAACTSLAKRGELAKRYGVPSVESALRAKGVAMTEIKPPREAKEKTEKKPGSNADDNSSNPWSSKFRLSGGPVKNEADREARINAERAKFIKMAGAAASARMAKAAGKTLGGQPLRSS